MITTGFLNLGTVKDEEACDIQVKFIHPFGTAPSFYWSYQNEDICFVPVQHILSIVEPSTTRRSGRVYYFHEKDMNCAHKTFVTS